MIVEHFTNIADNTPVPLIIYNNPFATAIDINLRCIETLSDHSNIWGIKDTDVSKEKPPSRYTSVCFQKVDS